MNRIHPCPRDARRKSPRSPALTIGRSATGPILVLGFLVLALSFCLPAGENPNEDRVAGFPSSEALRLGERLYRQGILPSGEYVQATVQGDLPVDGRAFNCMGCHQRSGLGSSEGNIVKLPITGPLLYKPYPKEQALLRSTREDIPKIFRSGDVRPAYTHETLARAIRQGVSSAGTPLNDSMPRYTLGDRDMEILIFYLDNLNRELSPGVDGTSIRFATVITEEVSLMDRQAMLGPLEGYIADKNAQTRNESGRAQHGSFDMQQMDQSYRRLVLDHWELKGPPETWRAQLDAYYRQAPVFALLGGISTLDWRPIHDFCEQNKIPCIFPVTGYPVISDTDWYTLYLSKGFFQEGETAARYLAGLESLPPDAAVLQVFRDGPRENRLAGAFRDTWRKLRGSQPVDIVLERDQPADADFWKELARQRQGAAIIAWLNPADLAGAAVLAGTPGRPHLMLASSSLLGESLSVVPNDIRPFTVLTYPHSLPQENKRILFVIEGWLQTKHIPFTDRIIQSNMYFLGWMMTMALMEMRSWFYRDYFMEAFDMSRNQDYAVGTYPRLSFGFGQRYASKGCYIVGLTDGHRPELIRKSDWVIP